METNKVVMAVVFASVIIAIAIIAVAKSGGLDELGITEKCTMVTKYKTVNEKNCEHTTGCECVHTAWGGLGQCDSCKCEYQEEVCE